MPKRSSPHPRVVHETAKTVGAYALAVAEHYAWLHSAAYDRTVGDDVKVRSTNPADPTGGLIASDHKRKGRRALENTAEGLEDTLAELKALEAGLLTALNRFDPRAKPELADESQYPRTALREDIEKAKEAQAKRRRAGEGVPT